MRFFKSVVALATLAVSVAAQNLLINTPAALIQCQPVALTFSGGTAPYFVSVIPGGQTQAAALVDFGQLSSSPYTWTVNLAAGTSVTLRIVDSSGVPAYSSPVTIQAGSSSSCLTSTISGTTVASTSINSAAASAATTTGASIVVTGSSAVASASSVASSVASVSRAASSAAASSAASSSAAASSAATTSRPATSGNAASSIISSIVSAASSAARSSGAAMPTGVANAGAVLVGAMGAVAVLL